ncbi:AAA family ATPase [Xenorhabdus bharatensis]|uniref:AAA family ATPase n=1 Tax=Xenorhabdus bharatensis TaxID=3136256 RepID=UPI0030F43C2C
MNWSFSENKAWNALSDTFSFIADMSGVQQDPTHHAEGDVATHTQMVLSALVQLPEYQALEKEEQEILWASALLHDVEKRSTTRIDLDGRIISPGHARKGELTVRQVLFQQVATPFTIREQVAALVRFHGLPLWLMEKPEPQKALLAASLRVDTYLLALLAKADVLGRECHDAQELLERIELFELYCREQNCWRNARQFPSSEARFHYFSTESEQPDYQPYDNYGSQVILLCGLPGMGKDHFIRQYYPDSAVISLDAIRRQHQISPEDKNATGWVVQQAKKQAREKLRDQQSFIWNATNLTAQIRQQLIKLFVSYNARVKIVYIEQGHKQWRQQNNHRQYVVPDKVMDRMLSKLEVPTPEEAHEVCYFINGLLISG